MAQVLRPTSPGDASPHFSSSPLRRQTSTPRPSIITDTSALPKTLEDDVARYRLQLESEDEYTEPSSISSSPRLGKSSLNSTPASSVSFDKIDDRYEDEDDHQEPDDLYFPSYNDDPKYNINRHHSYRYGSGTEASEPASQEVKHESSTDTSSTLDSSTPGSPGSRQVADDTAVQEEPSRQVDYLSHDWREEDIWRSWQHIVSNRRVYGDRSRLENASWRTWAKSKYRLKTVTPESLNWLKDCDVTWLYGPLQESSTQRSVNSSHLSKSNSFINKKPCLKKRSVSEVMLQKSLSNSSLVRQAAAAVEAQRSCMKGGNGQDGRHLSRTPSDFLTNPLDIGDYPTAFTSTSSSGLQSPDNGRKHIRFDDTVEQCIAVDFDANTMNRHLHGIAETKKVHVDDEEEDEDDDVIMLKTKSHRKSSSTSSSRRSSVGQESKGIAMLPSTTLKYHDHELSCPGHEEHAFDANYGGRLQPSASQETLRPKDPSSNFLIEDDDDEDMAWEPSGAFGRSSNGQPREPRSEPEFVTTSSGLRRTASGMFMPFDEEEEEQSFASTGMLGRVVDTVNTARDIMHVIMNVGWRS